MILDLQQQTPMTTVTNQSMTLVAKSKHTMQIPQRRPRFLPWIVPVEEPLVVGTTTTAQQICQSITGGHGTQTEQSRPLENLSMPRLLKQTE